MEYKWDLNEEQIKLFEKFRDALIEAHSIKEIKDRDFEFKFSSGFGVGPSTIVVYTPLNLSKDISNY